MGVEESDVWEIGKAFGSREAAKDWIEKNSESIKNVSISQAVGDCVLVTYKHRKKED